MHSCALPGSRGIGESRGAMPCLATSESLGGRDIGGGAVGNSVMSESSEVISILSRNCQKLWKTIAFLVISRKDTVTINNFSSHTVCWSAAGHGRSLTPSDIWQPSNILVHSGGWW